MPISKQEKNIKVGKVPRPVVLLIMDGWGVAPPSRGNAVTLAKTPVFIELIKNYPVMTLQASGEAVGLSWGEQGNSEVGHLNLGSGKICYQNLPRINKSITDGSFFKVPALLKAANQIKKNNSNLHLLGLVSNGGVHSHQDHLHALLDFCKEQKLTNVFIHAILDGRDTAKNEGLNCLTRLQEKIKEVGLGKIATVAGRFYALDRDNRWERTAKAYRAIVEGKALNQAADPLAAVLASYNQKIYDEEFLSTVIIENGKPVAKVKSQDVLIFFNFRGDRARQLTAAIALPGFNKFKRPKYLKDLLFITFTEYDKNLPVAVAFLPLKVENPLAKILAANKLKQLHVAETEKYAHVTFFFNGGQEEPFAGEDRLLVPSPLISSYDQKPEMSAFTLTEEILKAIIKDQYHFIVVNFANPDMVGHTGNLDATVKAIETVDQCLGEITKLVLQKNGTVVLVADHGNAEELINLQTGEIGKEHSTNPVPFIVVGKALAGQASKFGSDVVGNDLSIVTPAGMLADVTPTILKIMNLPIPKEMDGQPLI